MINIIVAAADTNLVVAPTSDEYDLLRTLHLFRRNLIKLKTKLKQLKSNLKQLKIILKQLKTNLIYVKCILIQLKRNLKCLRDRRVYRLQEFGSAAIDCR